MRPWSQGDEATRTGLHLGRVSAEYCLDLPWPAESCGHSGKFAVVSVSNGAISAARELPHGAFSWWPQYPPSELPLRANARLMLLSNSSSLTGFVR